MYRLSSCLLAALAAVLGLVPPARAAQDGRADAEKLIRHGVELRRDHDDEAAQREFQKAYDLVHTPRAAGQLGLAEQALGRWEDAERHVSEAIHAAADPWVIKNRTALDQALNTIQAHLGRVEVISDQEGAAVSVNGKEVGHLPLPEPVRVSAGQVDIEVSAPGYTSVQRTVSIVGGQYQKVVIHLPKEAPAPVAQPQPSAGPEPTAPAALPPAPAAEPESSSVRPVLKWTAAGLGGAGLITGVVFTILHQQGVSSFDGSCGGVAPDGRILDKMGNPSSSCDQRYKSNQTDQLAFIVGYAAAGAFAATWLILQLTEPSSSGGSAEHASRGPICLPAPSGVGVSCALRF
jgi:hypothetical protein